MGNLMIFFEQTQPNSFLSNSLHPRALIILNLLQHVALLDLFLLLDTRQG